MTSWGLGPGSGGTEFGGKVSARCPEAQVGQVLSACREGPAAPHHGAPASLLRLPLGKELVLLEQGSQRGGQLWQLSLAMAFCPAASERRLWRALRSLWPETPPPPTGTCRERAGCPSGPLHPPSPAGPLPDPCVSPRSLGSPTPPPYAGLMCVFLVRVQGLGFLSCLIGSLVGLPPLNSELRPVGHRLGLGPSTLPVPVWALPRASP